MNRTGLADFLRARRTRLQPDDVGLPRGRGRRTPGLRREEVAELAQISIDYYVRLEQARGPFPSAQVLASLARALRLSHGERMHLFHLAGKVPPAYTSPSVAPGLSHLVDQVSRPATIVDRRFDVVAWNPLAGALLYNYPGHAPRERNLVWLHFMDREVRRRLHPEDWDRSARCFAAHLRVERARVPSDGELISLVRRLRTASDEFARFWDEHDVISLQPAPKQVLHPVVGPIDLECVPTLSPEHEQWLMMFAAVPGTGAERALARLAQMLPAA